MSYTLTHQALHAQGLSTSEKIVLIALADHLNDTTGECWPSQQTIANLCGMSRQAVNGAISRLKRRGFISTAKSDHRTPYYKFALTCESSHCNANVTPQPVNEDDRWVSTRMTGGVNDDDRYVSTTMTQTDKRIKNIEDKLTDQPSVPDRQTIVMDNVCLSGSQKGAGKINFDFAKIEQDAVARLIREGYDAHEAAGRVAAVKEQVYYIAKDREEARWRNQNGEKILHPQKHLIGTMVGLAKKFQYQQPPITREELEREVFDPANKHRFSGALNPLGFIADDNDIDAFWGWLVANEFENSDHEVITRKNFWGTLYAYMAIRFKDSIDFYARL